MELRPDARPAIISSGRVVDDDRTPLALAAGLVAAIVAGGLWALLVNLSNMEVGYAAWGIGLLVGAAMSAVTAQRTQGIAYAAAVLAFVGLLAGKAFIFAGATDDIAHEITEDEEATTSAVAWELYAARALDEETLAGIDATRAAGDTLSDALWEKMLAQASAKIGNMSAKELEAMVASAAVGIKNDLGMVGGIKAQLSVFDLLWVLLAVGTAYKMLAPAGVEAAPESETT